MRGRESLIYTTDNCTGCNRCISACTVPEANYVIQQNGVNKILIDGEKCINCAKCLIECPHNARDYRDDTEVFLDKLGRSSNISVIVAPAIRTNFPHYHRLIGQLRKMGVKFIYDTSFGADICTWGYIRYMEKNSASGLISQPCPAVVNYIEKHADDLLPSLAPVHSPLMCTAVYMRKYKNIQGEIAFLSPCIAKKDEIEDQNTQNLVQYNVTFKKLEEALARRGIDYLQAPADNFDNQQHGMGSLYPMPGGLKTTVHRVIPDAWVYQVEGQPEVRNFLHDYTARRHQKDASPFLVDVLNCAKGCNLGTGAICREEDDLSVSRIMYNAQQEAVTKQKTGKVKSSLPGSSLKDFDKELRLEDFVRSYANKKIPTIRYTQGQVENAYGQMLKYTPEERKVDCCSCGYQHCEEMAVAIAKGLNNVNNCVEYHKSVLQSRQDEIEAMLAEREQSSRDLKANIERIFESLSEATAKNDDTVNQVGSINEEVTAVRQIAHRLNEMVDTLQENIEKYVSIGSHIVTISMQTQLLSMNASVEAAHAKELGKGFAVVAEEMKNLSERSASSAKEILYSNDLVLPILEEVRSFSRSLDSRTEKISESTQAIFRAMQLISETEQGITEAASRIVSEQEQQEELTWMSEHAV